MKYIIYDDKGSIYDIRYSRDGWTLEKCQEAYAPMVVKEVRWIQ